MSLQILAQAVTTEQSEGTPLTLIISILSAAGSLLAVVMSKRALDYAKGEPLRAAQRELNGELREKITSVLKDVEELQNCLRIGKNILEEPTSLEESRLFLSELAARRPNEMDSSRHQSTAIAILSLSMYWRTAAHDQKSVDDDANYIKRRRAAENPNPSDLGQLEEKLDFATRRRDASYLQLKEEVQKTRHLLKDEIKVLDKIDRGELSV